MSILLAGYTGFHLGVWCCICVWVYTSLRAPKKFSLMGCVRILPIWPFLFISAAYETLKDLRKKGEIT